MNYQISFKVRNPKNPTETTRNFWSANTIKDARNLKERAMTLGGFDVRIDDLCCLEEVR